MKSRKKHSTSVNQREFADVLTGIGGYRGWIGAALGGRLKRKRGRPRGTGHPKRKLADLLASICLTSSYIRKLEKAGMNDGDLRVLFACVRTKSQKAAAEELRVSPQAINKRWKKRIEPALRHVNPHFSINQLRSAIAERSPE